jgi:hypothetical protein
MRFVPLSTFRILAIDPCSQGFGFAIFEEPARLLDWGVKNSARHGKHPRTRRRGSRCAISLVRLLDRYRPSLIVVRDRDDASVRHRRLVEQLRSLAAERQIELQMVSWDDVRAMFSTCGVKTKEEIATAISTRFPELLPLPRHRKPWMSEDYRMNIYDAVAIGLVSAPIVGMTRTIRSP